MGVTELLYCRGTGQNDATTFTFSSRSDSPFRSKAIHIPSLFGVCSDALNEVLNVYSVLSRDSAVINIIIPQIAQMKPLAIEAVQNNDYDMCRRITLIYTQLGNDYLTLLIDDNNTYKDELLDVSFPDLFDLDNVYTVFFSID